MRALLRLLFKIVAFPLLAFFKPKLMFDEPAQRFWHPRGPLLVVVNSPSKSNFLCLSLLAFFHCLHPLALQEEARSAKRWLFAGIAFEDDLSLFFQKKRIALVFVRSEEEEASVLRLAQKEHLPLQLIAQGGRYGFFRRPSFTFANVYRPGPEEDVASFSHRFADLLELGVLYQKYHAFGTFHGSFFIMDLARILVLPKLFFFYPTQYLYESPQAKANRHAKKEGIALSNHVAFADAQMLPRVYPRRRIRMVVGDIVFRNNGKLMHFWLKEAHVLHVSDAEADPALSLASLIEAKELLRCHVLLGIFPEGRINWDGAMGKFYTGAVGLALLSGAPLYPSVTLRKYRAFHRQYVVVGNPIDLRKELKEGETLSKPTFERLARLLEEKLQSLREEGQRQVEDKGAKR
jgi:1-acyl-sn-glycerol-3-phosphate acyltransferase